MSCMICFNQYDHSNRKPYMLSCPHTFCLSCVNLMVTNNCPTCNARIQAKHPNLALLEFIPESLYDKLKADTLKTLSEINDIKKVFKNNRKSKLVEYKEMLSSIKNDITSETAKLVSLLINNQENLLKEVEALEENLEKSFITPELDTEIARKLQNSKQLFKTNTLCEVELNKMLDDLETLKTQINEFYSSVEELKANFEFNLNENVSIKDGLIGEIVTNEKVILN